MSGHFAYGKNMVCWQQQTSVKCPQCSIGVEDKAHIIKCPHEQVTTKWNKAISLLTEWTKEENSALHLIQVIEDGLQAWRQDTQSPRNSPATSQQSQIGWDTALNGWLGLEWQAQQEMYWSQWHRKNQANAGQWNLLRNFGTLPEISGISKMRPCIIPKTPAMIS